MNENLDNYAGAYEENFKYSLDNRLILKWYPSRIVSKIHFGSLLELGLGHGYTIDQFMDSKKISYYRILEGSKEIIELFKRDNRALNVDIIQTYFEDYDTRDRFDNIVMGFVLEHVNDPATIIVQYSKYLKPGGSLFVAVPNAEALNRRFGYEAGVLKDLEQLSASDIQLGHKRYFTLKKLTKLIHDNGLKVKSVEGLFLKPITTDQIKTLNLTDKILMAMLKVGIHYPELCTGILMEAAVE